MLLGRFLKLNFDILLGILANDPMSKKEGKKKHCLESASLFCENFCQNANNVLELQSLERPFSNEIFENKSQKKAMVFLMGSLHLDCQTLLLLLQIIVILLSFLLYSHLMLNPSCDANPYISKSVL